MRARVSMQKQGSIILKSRSQAQLEAIGATIANVAPLPPKLSVVCLTGDMGAGKTCFARGFIRELVGDPEMVISSPTYLLDSEYNMRTNAATVSTSIHHIDLYRLAESITNEDCGTSDTISALSCLDLEQIFASSVCLVEWAEHLGSVIPPTRLEVAISFSDDMQGREVLLTAIGEEWCSAVSSESHTQAACMLYETQRTE